MSPTSDKKPDTHNKIPEDITSTQSRAGKIDHNGWEEYFQQHGSETDHLFPHVRYGFIDEDTGLRQENLSPLTDKIPADASFVSPGIYFLTHEEVAQVSRGIPAKRIQTACEEDDRVAYTVVAESDAMEKGATVQTIINWLTSLAAKFGIEETEYRLFFSGNRSIHLHTDYYVRHENLHRLKETVEEFCQQQGADLDISIYKGNGQFRLIGAKHRKTDLYKVPVPANADRPEVVRRTQDFPELSLPHSIPKGRKNNNIAGNDSRNSLPQEYESRLLWGYINDSSSDIDWDPNTELDGSYTNRCFSPYANTGDGERSICVFEPKGGAFCRRDEKKIYLPSHIYGSRGADGEYVIRDRKAPLLLSGPDYEKREFETGETLVIIGGQSRESRIFEINEFDRELISNQLNLPDHDDQRQLVFTWLEDQGYSVGESGMHGEPRESASGASAKIQQLKQKLIQADRTPTHEEAVSISCSILQTDGYKEAWEWNKRAWGHQFDPEITRQQLKYLVTRYFE